MVQLLIDAINSLQHNKKQQTTKEVDKKSKLRGTLSLLGRYLKVSFENTLAVDKKKRKKKKASSIALTPQVIRSPSSLSSQSTQPSIRIPTNSSDSTSTITDACSPPRRRKGRLPNSNDTNASSPRKGDKTKFMRMSTTMSESGALDTTTTTTSIQSSYTTFDNDTRQYETTNFLGHRRLHQQEIVRLDVNQSLILIIPSNKKADSKEIKELRNEIRSRIVSTVLESRKNDYKDIRLAGDRKKKALDQLESENGIKRNDGTYIELPCIVTNYPHKEEYRNEICTKSEVEKHVDQGGGFNIRLLNYSCNDSTLIKWSEIDTVQFYVKYYRGDPRPQISLSERRQDYLYCDELTDKLAIVQDDVIQTLELALAYEKQKTNILHTLMQLKL